MIILHGFPPDLILFFHMLSEYAGAEQTIPTPIELTELTAEDWQPTADGWRRTTDYWRLTTDDWRLTTDDWQLTTDDWQMTNDKWRLTADDCRLTADDWRLTTDDWRLTADGWRLTADGWRLTAVGWRLSADGWRLTADGWRLTADGWRPVIRHQSDLVQPDFRHHLPTWPAWQHQQPFVPITDSPHLRGYGRHWASAAAPRGSYRMIGVRSRGRYRPDDVRTSAAAAAAAGSHGRRRTARACKWSSLPPHDLGCFARHWRTTEMSAGGTHTPAIDGGVARAARCWPITGVVCNTSAGGPTCAGYR